ncbi:MAG: tetraacyldisaccharide 4'-kinase [Candidatus Omnitrophica bacterium]|nr:tetraacyldisaccharide 4'-kinase [Candidatus Omnitrophota bacterium]MDD5573921.1 tetraacyldisaccharide 4'-kinase [Candidatus Omnitrophota bacterium]
MKGLESFYVTGRLTATFILLFPLLFVLSWIYAVCLFIIKEFYRRGILRRLRPQSRVVSVGNMTLGGSGKTPLVGYVAEKILAAGCPAAVVFRGYGRPSSCAAPHLKGYQELGDEGTMTRENLAGRARVLAGPDRAALVRRLEDEGFRGVIVLDDGFQHWRLQRDLDIVAVDACRPFGNGLLLPAGPLRETRRALKRASVLCVTRSDQASPEALEHLKEILSALNPRALIAEAVHEPLGLYDVKIKTPFAVSILRGMSVGLVCGIAQPGSFEKTVVSCGARVVSRSFFRDHHVYSGDDIVQSVQAAAAKNARAILTTQKDAVRLEGFVRDKDLGMDIFVLKVGIRIRKRQEEFNARIRALCHP